MVFVIVSPFNVGCDELRGLFYNWVSAVEIVFILCIEILPPQTLDHPWGHSKLIGPRRHWISYDLARRWVRRYRKHSAWKSEMFCREFRGDGQEVLAEFYER